MAEGVDVVMVVVVVGRFLSTLCLPVVFLYAAKLHRMPVFATPEEALSMMVPSPGPIPPCRCRLLCNSCSFLRTRLYGISERQGRGGKIKIHAREVS